MEPGSAFSSRAGRLKFDAREEDEFFLLPLLADHLLIPAYVLSNGRETFPGNKNPGYEAS
jgi:hypothetical protein